MCGKCGATDVNGGYRRRGQNRLNGGVVAYRRAPLNRRIRHVDGVQSRADESRVPYNRIGVQRRASHDRITDAHCVHRIGEKGRAGQGGVPDTGIHRQG